MKKKIYLLTYQRSCLVHAFILLNVRMKGGTGELGAADNRFNCVMLTTDCQNLVLIIPSSGSFNGAPQDTRLTPSPKTT